jgi:hypothetical protein
MSAMPTTRLGAREHEVAHRRGRQAPGGQGPSRTAVPEAVFTRYADAARQRPGHHLRSKGRRDSSLPRVPRFANIADKALLLEFNSLIREVIDSAA